MSVAKGAVAGFVFGTAVSMVICLRKVKRRPWVIEAETKERLNRKETLAIINDQAEDLAIFRAMVMVTPDNYEEFTHYIPLIEIKALTDPVWARLRETIMEDGDL